MTNDNYVTPRWLMNIFEDWYDPCPIDWEGKSFKNGLNIDWVDKTYVNPPYSNPSKWIDKAIEENKKGNTIVMLLPVDSSTKWFAKLIEAGAEMLWFARRIHFIEGSPRFASMLVILSGDEK